MLNESFKKFKNELCRLIEIDDCNGCNSLLLNPEYQDPNVLVPCAIKAAEKGNFEILNSLLKYHALQDNIAAYNNAILSAAAKNGHENIVRMLLNYPNVIQNIATDNNWACLSAAAYGHLNITKQFLKFDAVQEHLQDVDNRILRFTAANGHLQIIRLIWEEVKENAHAFRNGALKNAALKGHLEVMDILLTEKKVRDNPNNIIILRELLISQDVPEKLAGYNKILNKFLAKTTVYKEIFQNGGEILLELMNDEEIPDIAKLSLLNNLELYGIKLSDITSLATFEIEFKKVLVNPKEILTAKQFPLSRILAASLLHEYQIQDWSNEEHKLEQVMQKLELHNQEEIQAVMMHFNTVIKPYFQNKNKASINIDKIESEIRLFLLKNILENAKERKKSGSLNEDFLINELNIIFDQPELLASLSTGVDIYMAHIRPFLNHTDDNAQNAWRAYDKGASVSGWLNLLTPTTLTTPVFSMKEIAEGNITGINAAAISRELLAYSFLLAIDNNNEPTLIENMLANFTAQVSDIRRAHNMERGDDEPAELDDPSCLPGIVTRVRNIWLMHPLGVPLTIKEQIQEILKNILVPIFKNEFYKCKGDIERSQLYDSLVMLMKENAYEIAQGINDDYSDLLAARRECFLKKLPSFDFFISEINNSLNQMHYPKLDKKYYQDVKVFLSDIGGRWIINNLNVIYNSSTNHALLHEESKKDRPPSPPTILPQYLKKPKIKPSDGKNEKRKFHK